jgi:cytochrome c556
MKRLACVLGLLAVAALAVWVGQPLLAADKEPTVKEIMTKAHKGGNSLLAKLGKELKAEEPPWETVQQQTKELVTLGASLGKNKPPKGSQESWDRLTKAYLATAKALDGAAKEKGLAVARAQHKALTQQCGACHKAHRPPPKED